MEDGIRIEIEPNGPYVVYGDVPLREMSPVHTFNGEPIAWHTLREVSPAPGRLELCRCGRSSTKPFCDNSHEGSNFDGTETADRASYEEQASVQRVGEHAIADAGAFCVSAGFCGTRTTDVWKLLGQSADPQKYELMRDMVWRCPSGRLVVEDGAGQHLEPALPQEIAVLPGGPLWIRGGIPVVSADGTQWEIRNRVTLCRCGGSRNKPFCDGSHESMHFDER